MISEHITARHLSRKAVIYIRQSTPNRPRPNSSVTKGHLTVRRQPRSNFISLKSCNHNRYYGNFREVPDRCRQAVATFLRVSVAERQSKAHFCRRERLARLVYQDGFTCHDRAAALA